MWLMPQTPELDEDLGTAGHGARVDEVSSSNAQPLPPFALRFPGTGVVVAKTDDIPKANDG